MKTKEVTVTTTWYVSEVHPEFETNRPEYVDAIRWADANPVAWEIVLGKKSKVYGIDGDEYFGSDRGTGGGTAIARVHSFWRAIHRSQNRMEDGFDFFQWRAQFTLDHYKEKGFKTVHLKQWDGGYFRNTAKLGYTPKRAKEVIDAFERWCEHGFCRYELEHIELDGKIVRRYPKKRKVS